MFLLILMNFSIFSAFYTRSLKEKCHTKNCSFFQNDLLIYDSTAYLFSSLDYSDWAGYVINAGSSCLETTSG